MAVLPEHPMSPLNLAARRLLVLSWLVPLPELTQDEVDYVFRRLVEDALQTEEGDDPPAPGEPTA